MGDEKKMERFGALMVQGMEVLKYPQGTLSQLGSPQLRIFYMDPEHTAIYCSKVKGSINAKEFKFAEIASVAPTPGSDRPQITVTGNDGNSLTFEVDTMKSQELLTKLLTRLVEVSAPTAAERARVLMDSYAEKRMGTARFAMYKRRFFVLEDHWIKGYDSRVSSRARVVEKLDLNSLQSVVQDPNEDRALVLRFGEVQVELDDGADQASAGPGRGADARDDDALTATLRFSSRDLARRWCDALQRFVQDDASGDGI